MRSSGTMLVLAASVGLGVGLLGQTLGRPPAADPARSLKELQKERVEVITERVALAQKAAKAGPGWMKCGSGRNGWPSQPPRWRKERTCGRSTSSGWQSCRQWAATEKQSDKRSVAEVPSPQFSGMGDAWPGSSKDAFQFFHLKIALTSSGQSQSPQRATKAVSQIRDLERGPGVSLAVVGIRLALPRSLEVGPWWLHASIMILLLIGAVVTHEVHRVALNRILG